MDTEYSKGFKAGYDFGYKDAANENRYNTGVKVGIAYEQDRILELLKERAKGDYKQVMITPELIDIIKGKP
jgi:hypothetical protein